ncbi:MBL fold metallo-hydrolase [Leptospira ellisii]|uniref:MBL fold metallo-hydrolase n=1 Tax=Leptospira ellisii TaxID=2023197 RepID=A0A2N0B9K9_9LEPT|nr:MBL fold metallo-hydrolase [Leptospira ellisii]MDV6235453.1 MBL fold metallo-hydrolase [Leptospira ellisii]PJZ93196.1 MBL fold metallo-hydrolase [Leptospira ellisii]PKA03877.1 MBL fold metallo-hydrolase [Leptospira ellisii]
MANPLKKRTENAEGNFYVDSSCIDCETCRILAPSVFAYKNGASYVCEQPSNDADAKSALRALVACPTASIGTVDRTDLSEAKGTFPAELGDGVYYCGYHSKSSFGAFSYLIVREEGNVLVDSPRFVPSLAEKIQAFGGIRYQFLTHRDDVADHAKFRETFGCERIIHEGDKSALPDAEIVFRGTEAFELAKDLILIPTPGHTKGHAVLLYKNRILFTGDHLAFQPGRERLIAFRDACWYSWKEQTESMQKLEAYSFERILPGHGRPYQGTAADVRTKLRECVEWMRGK